MKKMFAAVLMALALLAGGLSFGTAAQAYPGCAANRMCLHDTATSAPFFDVEPVDTVLNKCITGINPITSNITNNTNYRWIVSTSSNCEANRGIIYPHSSGAMGPTWNNNIRGMYRTSMTSFVGPEYPPAIK